MADVFVFDQTDIATTVTLTGELDIRSSRSFQDSALSHEIQDRDITFDASDVTYLDISWAQMLNRLHENAREKGVVFSIRGISDQVMLELRGAGLGDDFLPLDHVLTEENAC